MLENDSAPVSPFPFMLSLNLMMQKNNSSIRPHETDGINERTTMRGFFWRTESAEIFK